MSFQSPKSLDIGIICGKEVHSQTSAVNHHGSRASPADTGWGCHGNRQHFPRLGRACWRHWQSWQRWLASLGEDSRPWSAGTDRKCWMSFTDLFNVWNGTTGRLQYASPHLFVFLRCEKPLFLRLRTSSKHLNHSTEGKDLEKTDGRSFLQRKKFTNSQLSAASVPTRLEQRTKLMSFLAAVKIRPIQHKGEIPAASRWQQYTNTVGFPKQKFQLSR